MPIHGLTTNTAPAFPHLGELRKGEEKVSDNKPGKDLRHFRYTSKVYPESVKAFAQEFGNEPNHLTILLPYRTVDENFPTWRESWTASRLQHRCDGRTCVLSLSKDGKTYTHEPKPCPGGCKQIGRLTVIVPELLHAGFVGTVTVLTTSIHDIMEVHANLLSYQQMRGDLRGVEFVLSRVPRMITTPDGPRREKWLINIKAHHEWVVAQLAAMKQTAMLPAVAGVDITDMLPPDIVDEDGVIISGEYTIEPPKQIAAQVVQKANDDLFGDEPTQEQPEQLATPVAAEKQGNAAKSEGNGKANGNGQKKWPARPFDAPTLKAYMETKVAGGKTSKPSDKQLTYVRASLMSVALDDAERHTITLYLFGKESSSDLTAGECSALLDWIKYQEVAPDEWQPNDNAMFEAKSIIRQWQVEQGQQEMAF